MDLKENYLKVEEKIRRACMKAGRAREEVTLIAVSKTKPIEMMEEMASFGQTVFGENHVQEIVEKYEKHPEYTYHMIGHLQRNKVRQVVGKVAMIHSVDSLRLAEEIAKESEKHGIVTDILIEINAGNEESKYGFTFEEAEERIREIAVLHGIHVCGLMCVAPYVQDPEENRPIFRKMYELAVDIRAKNIDNVEANILSMGMTNDYETAISEGATMVRVGTGLFGARDYTKGVIK